jgi:adenine phosphoribosyltransferase
VTAAGSGEVPGIGGLIAAHTRDIPDFPLPGVMFKDLTPLFADGPAFAAVVDALRAPYGGGSDCSPEELEFDIVAGVEARGFVLAAAVAYAAGVGLVPLRKQGKLPGPTKSASYALEYGEATLEVHTDAFSPGDRVLVVDDVLATGGTAGAALALVEQSGAEVAGFACVLELAFLKGRDRLAPRDIHALSTI